MTIDRKLLGQLFPGNQKAQDTFEKLFQSVAQQAAILVEAQLQADAATETANEAQGTAEGKQDASPNLAALSALSGEAGALEQTVPGQFGIRPIDSTDLHSLVTVLGLQNVFGGLTNAANDSAAATAGVAVGALYRNGSVIMVRET